MPFIKGSEIDGAIHVSRAIQFDGAVNLGNKWADTYYVDPTNGSDTNTGKSTGDPFKSLRHALTAASAYDVIYLRPPTQASISDGDPTNTTPDTAVNWTVPYASYGLSIIGTGVGMGMSANYQTGLRGYAALTTPVLYVKAPYVMLQNLTFRNTASTGGVVKLAFVDAGSIYSFGATVYDCTFWQVASTAGGALLIDSAWYTTVQKCTFKACYNGINIGAGNSVPKGIIIKDCDFLGLTTDVSADISTSGATTSILITGCQFNHALPAAGSPNKFVNIASASTGLISDSSFGVADATIANSLTLNGITNAHLWGMSAEIT